MPFFYDIYANQTTNATVNTENQAGRLLTVANQAVARLKGCYIGGRMTSAGGALLRLKVASTPGTVGTAYTPRKRNPNSPAAQITAFTAHTVGTIDATRIIVGCSATGGYGGWVALNDDQALTLLPNGGANGNMEATNISALASTVIEWLWEIDEG